MLVIAFVGALVIGFVAGFVSGAVWAAWNWVHSASADFYR